MHGKAKPGGSGCLEVDIITETKDENGKPIKLPPKRIHSKINGDGPIKDHNIDELIDKIEKYFEKFRNKQQQQ